MARFLCAWEFGADLGHVRRLVPVAESLRALGHEVCIAFRDSAHLEDARGRGFEAFLAPLLRVPQLVSPTPISFSDVLLNIGFADRHSVSGALRAWHSMLELLDTQVVVADYAPTAMIAARVAGLKIATIGTGFALPPPEDPLPALRPWTPVDEDKLRAIDERLVSTLTAAIGPAGADRAPRLARDVFTADAHLLCTFPELDPFGPRATGDYEYVGPQGDATSGEEVRWQGEAGARIFAYLKPRDRRFDTIVEALHELDAESVVAAPGLEAARVAALSRGNVRVIPAPVNLDLLLGEATLCITHAGFGVAARALTAGVPLGLLPLHLEQFLIARRVEQSGAARVVRPDMPQPDFREWFTTMLADAGLREGAQRHAGAHPGHSFGDATRRAAERIAQVAG